MKKYTAILDFRGGIYISQVYAKSINEASCLWANKLDSSEIKYLGERTKLALISCIKSEQPILLQDMDNVWCYSGLLRTGFFIVHIVG